jgi:hypothetical protein
MSRFAIAPLDNSTTDVASPVTHDRDGTAREMELMQAMHEYKQSSGRMFPTWSEVLEVLHGLGYWKPVATEATTPTTVSPPGRTGSLILRVSGRVDRVRIDRRRGPVYTGHLRTSVIDADRQGKESHH